MKHNFQQTNRKSIPHLADHQKRFTRKPQASSSRSRSRKSSDSLTSKETYIKAPKLVRRSNNRSHGSFFDQLADQLNQFTFKTVRKERLFADSVEQSEQNNNKSSTGSKSIQEKDKSLLSQYSYGKQSSNLQVRVNILEAEIDLKNHELSVLSSQYQQVSLLYQSEKEKKRQYKQQLIALEKQIRTENKKNKKLEGEVKRLQKQREYLFKQLEFLQKINFDEQTKSMQSYREQYLEEELQRLKNELSKDRSEREEYLDKQLGCTKQKYYTLQSEFKAMKVANEVLLKKIHSFDEQFHEIVLNSKEYKMIREKYVKFLQEYKKLRNEYWCLKAELTKYSHKQNMGDSDLLELTVSETDNSGFVNEM